MTKARFTRLSAIHKAAFAGHGRGWEAAEIEALAADGLIIEAPQGFALFREAAGEAELLTLAVAPLAQRKGAASAILAEALRALTANRIFLEVAADNAPAQALYQKFGFEEIGRRPGYYARGEMGRVDAVLMALDQAE